MITLTLLHPVQSTPVQSWSFEKDLTIRIGRAVDNEVVLYSAVVSRYHVEVRFTDNQWEVVNIGTNGTYLDGKRVHQAPLQTGSIMRLARSGPNIQIHIGPVPAELQEAGSAIEASSDDDISAGETDEPPGTASALAATTDAITAVGQSTPEPEAAEAMPASESRFFVSGRYSLFQSLDTPKSAPDDPVCDHTGNSAAALICEQCGKPIKVLKVVGPYQVLKPLGNTNSTFLAWRTGHLVVLKTLRPEWQDAADLQEQFKGQAQQLCQLEHPGMPNFFEAFEVEGQFYLVSEMIHGPTLSEWVEKQGAVPQYQAVQWGLEICRVLDYLHQQTPPYLHRSIHPSHLIRPRIPAGNSQVVLVNFGELYGFSSESGTVVGAVGYTSPEQQVGEVQPLSDLYGLGATLIFLLTGQEPDAFYRLGNDEFRLHFQNLPQVSPELSALLEKMTAPKPEDRFESAAAAAAALQRLL